MTVRQRSNGDQSDEEIQDALINAVADPLIVVDGAQRVVLFNRAAEPVFGYPAAEIVGRDLNVLLPAAYHHSHPQLVREFVGGGLGHSKPAWKRSRVEARRSDGSVFPAEISLSSLSLNGELHMVATVRDVSARVGIEGALRASEERFRAIFEKSPVAMAIVAPGGSLVAGNAALYEQTGYPREHLIGQWLGSIVHQDDRDLLMETLEPVASGAQDTARVELRYVRRDRAVRFMDLFVALADFETRLMIGQATDITDRIENQVRLEELVRSKDDLIASISHELRTPLTALVGFAELLQEGGASLQTQERGEMIRTIVAESIDLANIVDDLLVAARAEMGALTVARVIVDLSAQVAQVLEMWRRPGVQSIEVSGPPLRAWGDPGRVRQIVRNLVSNAVKYGAEPIAVHLVRCGESAIVAVTDHGEEISADDRARIFERYERAHQSTGVTASMGLGLPISRHLASLMGGGLDYRHSEGLNAFYLSLPAADLDE